MLPGAGYIYTGEYLRGYATWYITAFSLAFGPLVYEMDSCGIDFTCTSHDPSWSNRVAGAVLTGVGLWAWIAAARDAPKSAERANERHRRRELKADPIIDIVPQSAPQLTAGLRVDW
jgi:protein-S-isoprenylcysteine O-methyltransferase Ste14